MNERPMAGKAGIIGLTKVAAFITGAVLPLDGGQSAGFKPPQMYRQGQPMTAAPGPAARE